MLQRISTSLCALFPRQFSTVHFRTAKNVAALPDKESYSHAEVIAVLKEQEKKYVQLIRSYEDVRAMHAAKLEELENARQDSVLALKPVTAPASRQLCAPPGSTGRQHAFVTKSICWLFDPKTCSWSIIATDGMKTMRQHYAAAILADNRILVVGGRDNECNHLDSCEIFDPTTKQWSNAGRMCHGRSWPSAVTMADGRVLVFGGVYDGPESEIYDPPTNTWLVGGTSRQHCFRTVVFLPSVALVKSMTRRRMHGRA